MMICAVATVLTTGKVSDQLKGGANVSSLSPPASTPRDVERNVSSTNPRENSRIVSKPARFAILGNPSCHAATVGFLGTAGFFQAIPRRLLSGRRLDF